MSLKEHILTANYAASVGAGGGGDVIAPTITSTNTASVAEGATLSKALTADEAVTWTITGGADAARFEISGSTLRWASNGVKDFEAPNDADTDNIYVVQVTATDGSSNATNQTISVTVTDVDDTAPTITSANSANVAENATLSHALTANEAVTWSLTGGADVARFEVSGSTLRWASNGTKDFEAPDDANTDNAYVVQVTATDTATNAANQTVTITVTDVAEYNAEATALFARMSSQPDATRKGHINTLIAALKTGGIWAKLDVFYVLAAHDSQAAKLNWKSTSYGLTETATVTFLTDRGYTGDGVAGKLDTGFNPSTAGGNYAQNSGHLGVWVGTNVTSSSYDLGSTRCAINTRLSNAALLRASTTSADSVSLGVSTSVGWTAWSRNGSVDHHWVKDGGAAATVTRVSAAMSNENLYICNANGVAGFSTRRIQAAQAGSGLSDGELASCYTAIAVYMAAVGA